MALPNSEEEEQSNPSRRNQTIELLFIPVSEISRAARRRRRRRLLRERREQEEPREVLQ